MPSRQWKKLLGITTVLLVVTMGCAVKSDSLTLTEKSRLQGSWPEFLETCSHSDRFTNTDGDERVIFWCQDCFVFVDPKTGNIETHQRHR